MSRSDLAASCAAKGSDLWLKQSRVPRHGLPEFLDGWPGARKFDFEGPILLN